LVNRCASDFYNDLSAAEQAIVQRIFLSLCDLGDGGSLTRRPVALPELVTATMPEPAVIATLEKLMAVRLVVAQAQLGDRPAAAQVVPGWTVPLPPHPGEEGAGALHLPMVAENLGVTDSLGPTGTGVYFDIAHEALIRSWPLLQQWLQERGPRFRQQRALEVAALAWDQQGQPNHGDCFLTETRLNDALDVQQADPDQPSLVANRYLDACRRHARRSCRQRHLVRLLIPLSMVAGMATAYGHSHVTRPGQTLTVAKTPTNIVSDIAPSGVPTFELVSPAQGQSAEAVSPTPDPKSYSYNPALPALGSPQAGVVGTGLLRVPVAREDAPRQPYQTASSPLRSAMGRLTLAMGQSAAAPPPAETTAEAPLPGANQVVKLESWWVSPDDPALVIQIWCTRGGAEPVCFTTSTSTTAAPAP
jgi:hypothetical protein